MSKLSGAESDLDPSWTMASAAVYLPENSVHAEKMGRLAMAAEMRPRRDSVAMHRVELREWLRWNRVRGSGATESEVRMWAVEGAREWAMRALGVGQDADGLQGRVLRRGGRSAQ